MRFKKDFFNAYRHLVDNKSTDLEGMRSAMQFIDIAEGAAVDFDIRNPPIDVAVAFGEDLCKAEAWHLPYPIMYVEVPPMQKSRGGNLLCNAALLIDPGHPDSGTKDQGDLGIWPCIIGDEYRNTLGYHLDPLQPFRVQVSSCDFSRPNDIGLGNFGFLSWFNPHRDDEDPEHYDAVTARVGFDIFLLTIGVLGFKDVHRVEHGPSPRQQKKREAKGLDRIPSHTVIDCSRLVTRYEKTAGSHSSPRPHWRRGHVRRLPDGGLTMVRPCQVMGEAPKPQYIVKGTAR